MRTEASESKIKNKIFIFVVSVHILILTGLYIAPIPPPPQERQRKFKVKTVSLRGESTRNGEIVTSLPSEQVTVLEEFTSPPPPPKNFPKIKLNDPRTNEKEAPKVTKESTKKSQASPKKKGEKEKKQPKNFIKKGEERAKSSPKKETSFSKEALSKAKKALANLQTVPTLSTAQVSIHPIEFLASEKLDYSINADPSYVEEMINRLKREVHLPEKGEVVLELKLEKSGHILEMHIGQGVSLQNKLYVEKTLPNITLPPFKGTLQQEQSHTFTFVLNNR